MTREGINALAWLSERYDLGDKLDGLKLERLDDLVAHLDDAILKAVEGFGSKATSKASRSDGETLKLLSKVKAKADLTRAERERVGDLIGTLTDALAGETL